MVGEGGAGLGAGLLVVAVGSGAMVGEAAGDAGTVAAGSGGSSPEQAETVRVAATASMMAMTRKESFIVANDDSFSSGHNIRDVPCRTETLVWCLSRSQPILACEGSRRYRPSQTRRLLL